MGSAAAGASTAEFAAATGQARGVSGYTYHCVPVAIHAWLRHSGALTRTVTDTALSLNVLAGPDERDSNSLPAHGVDYVKELGQGIEGLRIAYSPDLGYAQVEPEVARICQQARYVCLVE